MKDLLITLPKKIKWEDYQRELDDVIKECLDINFRIPFLPKDVEFGKTKVYVTHNGIIKGYMILKTLRVFDDQWICDTSGTLWPAGKYLVRDGEFFPCKDPVKYKGFQGFRYIDYNKLYEVQFMQKICEKCERLTGPLHDSGCDQDKDPNCAWYVRK